MNFDFRLILVAVEHGATFPYNFWLVLFAEGKTPIDHSYRGNSGLVVTYAVCMDTEQLKSGRIVSW